MKRTQCCILGIAHDWNCTWFRFNGWWSAHVCGYLSPPPQCTPVSLIIFAHLLTVTPTMDDTWIDCVPPSAPRAPSKASQTITIPLHPVIHSNTSACDPYLKLDLSALDVHLALLLAFNNQIQAMKHLVCNAKGNVRPPLLFWWQVQRAFRVALPASRCFLRVKRVKYTSGACLPLLQELRRYENDRFHTTAAFI